MGNIAYLPSGHWYKNLESMRRSVQSKHYRQSRHFNYLVSHLDYLLFRSTGNYIEIMMNDVFGAVEMERRDEVIFYLNFSAESKDTLLRFHATVLHDNEAEYMEIEAKEAREKDGEKSSAS